MIGVSYGAPTEFRSNGAINEGPITWSPERVSNALGQDDLYVGIKWDAEDPCPDGALTAFNIDARINGAYIALGLLYGGLDFGRTLEIATRAGQDSDCNPSTAGGILGVMLGYSGIPDGWKSGIPALADTRFDYTRSSLNDICRSTLERALKLVQLAGGAVTGTDVVIPEQAPEAAPLDQWDMGVPVSRVAVTDGAWSFTGFSAASGSASREKAVRMAASGEGAEATLRFTGAALAVVGGMTPEGGRADVYLDGQPAHAIDAYVGARTHDNDLWHVYGLAQGPHTLRIVTPAIVPSSVFGSTAPSNRINVGAIGAGRISRGHDLPGIWKDDAARVMAVCDLDARRLEDGKRLVNDYYAGKTGRPCDGVAGSGHYLELLANTDIDAVVISTPDHWHALIALAAVEHRKDVSLQKPASLTIAEGQALSNAAHRSGRIFQIGSQQRSSPQFRYAAELVRNGRVGQRKTVEVGLPGDPSGGDEPEMPVPKNLNYEMWLGSTPYVYYTEKRVHPQTAYDRPGWLRCEQLGAGMITGWGAHHVDSADWGMDTEYTGPVEIHLEESADQFGNWLQAIRTRRPAIRDVHPLDAACDPGLAVSHG